MAHVAGRLNVAAAPCVASAASRRSDPTFFAATPHDSGPGFRSRLPPHATCVPQSGRRRRERLHPRAFPRRSLLRHNRFATPYGPAPHRRQARSPSGVAVAPTRALRAVHSRPTRRRAFPIAANPARGFARSGLCEVRFLAPQTPRRGPHRSLQIHDRVGM
jgi:hypothetical protein